MNEPRQSAARVSKARQPRFDSLQALRGVAATLVVLLHITDLGHRRLNYTFLGDVFSCGYNGVDLFFLLSGFIITFVHHRDLGNPGRFRQFATKRFIRIYPIYWIATLALIPVFFFVPSFGIPDYREPMTIVKSFLLIPRHNGPILGVAWTLCYEMWFYTLFGIAILFPFKATAPLMVLYLIACEALWFCRMVGVAPELSFGVDFVFNHLNLEFALGMLAAVVVLRRRVPRAGVVAVIGALLFAAIALNDAWILRTIGEKHRLVSYGIPSFLIIVGLAGIEMRRQVRIPRWLVCVGDASYSTYLVHVPVLSLAFKVLFKVGLVSPARPFIGLILVGIAPIAGGLLTHSFVEAPLLAWCRARIGIERRSSSPESSAVPAAA